MSMNMTEFCLTNDEKKVLKHLATSDTGTCPCGMSPYVFTGCVLSLANRKFVWYSAEEGGVVVEAQLTRRGRAYIKENPHLRNPVDWGFISFVASITALIVNIMLIIKLILK
jgi:hypothetical protein